MLVNHKGYNIALMPGIIFLYNDELAQAFKIDIAIERINDLDPSTVRALAQHYTEGHTNKTRFKFSITGLKENGKITGKEFQVLYDLIEKCSCRPAVILKKIEKQGLAKVIPHLDFVDEDPRLETSISVLTDYINCYNTKA